MNIDAVEEFGTQTHEAESGLRETVLVGVEENYVGNKNSYPPPNPFEKNLENEMRKGYFHYSGNIIAQIPRKSNILPTVKQKLELEDIILSKNSVRAYYPLNVEKAISLVWNYPYDTWEIETENFSDYVNEIYEKYPHTIWKNRRVL